MVCIQRGLTYLAFLWLIASSSVSIMAQDLKDRELRPGVDLSTIQLPVEIVSIKLNGKEVHSGEKVKGDNDWLRGLSFDVKNISDKPISYVAVALRFNQPNRIVVFNLSYGVDMSRGESRRDSSPPPIQPGETVNLVFTKERYSNLLAVLTSGDNSHSFEVVPYYVERICFEDDPDVIWEGGFLKRRDSTVIGKFNIIERYVLPVK